MVLWLTIWGVDHWAIEIHPIVALLNGKIWRDLK
jgi:hypothetical protein